MAVKVTQGQVNDGIRLYIKDETITGLSQEDETRLISLGVAELIPEEKKSKDVNPYAGKNAEEMIAIIGSMDNEDELKAVFESEQKGKNRKTIYQAIEAKMEAINKKDQDPNVDDDTDKEDQEDSEEKDGTGLVKTNEVPPTNDTVETGSSDTSPVIDTKETAATPPGFELNVDEYVNAGNKSNTEKK